LPSSQDTAETHTGTALITIANGRTTPSSSCPAPTRWSVPDDIGAAKLAKGDVAVSQFEIPLPDDRCIFQAGARSRRHHDPQSGAGNQVRAGDCSTSSISSILNETELGFSPAPSFAIRRSRRFIELRRFVRNGPSRSSA
jgi:ribokinase